MNRWPFMTLQIKSIFTLMALVRCLATVTNKHKSNNLIHTTLGLSLSNTSLLKQYNQAEKKCFPYNIKGFEEKKKTTKPGKLRIIKPSEVRITK